MERDFMELTSALTWRDYADTRNHGEHSVVGTLKVLESVEAPGLGNRRDILVHLPPSYADGAREYPVLYMHDGQNLFDRTTSFAGEWGVDETLLELSGEGIEAIVVGIPNTGEARIDEYSPFVDPGRGGGRGDAYLRFLVETVKPIVDRDFRTSREPSRTAILGSSMGGLISLHAFFAHPEVFGLVGAVSPSLMFARGAIFDSVATAPFNPGKIYMDVGTREGPAPLLGAFPFLRRHRPFVSRVREMRALLVRKGYREGRTLLVVEDRGGRHNETDWGRRLPDALRFLLGSEAP
jgi:predicted alpha/beta superfamily hydrolase